MSLWHVFELCFVFDSLPPPPSSPVSSRVFVLLPCTQSATPGCSHPLPAAGGCVWWISRHHVGGVHERQHSFGAVQGVHVHPAGLVVLPGASKILKWDVQCQNVLNVICECANKHCVGFQSHNHLVPHNTILPQLQCFWKSEPLNYSSHYLFFQIGFVLYPLSGPQWDLEMHDNVMFVTMCFCWHLAVALLLVTCTSSVVWL